MRALFEPAIDWKNWRNPDQRLISLWTSETRKRVSEVDEEVKGLEKKKSDELDALVEKTFTEELAKLPAEIQPKAKEARETAADKRTPEQQELIKQYPFLNVDRGSVYLYVPDRLIPFNKQWDETIAAAKAKRPPEDLVMCLTEIPGVIPATFLQTRGDFRQPKQEVAPGELAVLNTNSFAIPSDAPEIPTSGRRLAYAKHLTDGKHPLVGRVLVNRFWLHFFGKGLVATPGDFGAMGEKPSHPELLDWLAADFMEQGWSLKSLHRLIVTSASYRQSSQVTPELHARDPDNRLLARGPRFRVDAEIVRDIALAASGLLDFKVGGPSTHPPAPDFLFAPPASYGPKQWKMKSPDEPYRRALYTFRFRSVPYPMLQSFDAPNGDFSCVRRSRSNTPLQALTTLNEPLFVESAQNLAERTLREGGSTDADRLAYAFRLCVARSPRPDEVSILANIVQQQRKKLADQPAQAIQLAGLNLVELLPDENEPNPVERAAWTAVARILLNLDETITRE